MTAAGVRLACSPRAWTGLLLLAAGCAAPPMAAPPPPVAPGAAIPLRVQPVVRPAGGYQLRAFTPWGAADVATVTARLEDVTAGVQEVASASLDGLPLLGGAGPTGPGFDMGSLHPDRQYRLVLRAYRAVGGSSEAISIDDASSATFDTLGTGGEYPTAMAVSVPLALDDRPFPGLLDVVVEGVAGQVGMDVVLRPSAGASSAPVATTVVLAGAGSATLAFAGLVPDATYVIERFPFGGTVVASVPLSAVDASTTVSTAASAATAEGRVATATVSLQVPD